MPIRFKAELIGGRSFSSALVKFSERLQDWRTFWATRFIPLYLNDVQQNFETEGELSTRAGWPSLEPDYDAWKTRHFPGRKILERTRRLRESLSPSGLGSSDQFLEARSTSLRLGTRVPYARYHTWRRPFLVPITQNRWRPIFEEWVAEKAAEQQLLRRERAAAVAATRLARR